MTLHPEDVRYWIGWIIMGTLGFTVLYWVIKSAVIAALREHVGCNIPHNREGR